MAEASICRNCFHSYVCEQFNENKDDNNEKCHFLNDHYVPIADVVPKSEVDRLNAVMKEMDEQRAYTINMLGESIEKAKAEVDRLTNILDSYALQYGTVMDKHIVIEKARQEVAREIFEEIEKVFTVKYPMCTNPVLVLDSLSYAELKKKYTESEGKP